MKVYNFSHPLNLRTVAQISEAVKSEIEIVNISVQLDMDKPLYPQIFEVVKEVECGSLIIPPGMGAAAAILVKSLAFDSDADGLVLPRIIWLKRNLETNIFELGGIE